MASSAYPQTAKTYGLSKLLMGLVVLAMGFVTFTARAQPTPRTNSTTTVSPVDADVVVLGDLASMDLSNRSKAWWKARVKADDRALDSPDAQVKEQALQNIIFFATHYGKDVDFKRATTELYNIYRFDKNEAHRIMALAALHAIGRDNTMRILSQHVRWEKSPRVRRLTKAALVDYYAHAAP